MVEIIIRVVIAIAAVLGLMACIAAWYFKGVGADPVLMGALVTILTLILNKGFNLKAEEKESAKEAEKKEP